MVGQKADAVREQTEQQAHEEVSDALGFRAPLFKTGGELGKLPRRCFCDAGGGALGTELLGIGESLFEDFERRDGARGRGEIGEQVVQREAVDVRAGSGEVCMDFEKVLIADHQQGGILKVFAVIVELKVGGFQVPVLALVLPAEESALPYIGEPLAAFEGGDVLLKGEGVSSLIGGGGMGLVEDFAKVDEMGLRGGALSKRAGLPAADEFGKGERHGWGTLG